MENHKYEGQQNIISNRKKVWDFINDAQQIGQCLPRVNQIKLRNPKELEA
jgi:carbon monoxide dehydrogenase subunit G